ncbi:hypothetical protein KBA73_00595 [Patescibacteria group bacterium]|nr:hypothetical protein [Patescibacteria group bacterium]
MSFVFAFIIAVFVFLVAYAIYSTAHEILEEKSYFWAAIWGFFALYAVAALAMYFLLPPLQGGSDVSGMFETYFTMIPDQLEQGGIKER